MIVRTTFPATPPQIGAMIAEAHHCKSDGYRGHREAGCEIANGELSKLHVAAKQADNRSENGTRGNSAPRPRCPFEAFLLEQL